MIGKILYPVVVGEDTVQCHCKGGGGGGGGAILSGGQVIISLD